MSDELNKYPGNLKHHNVDKEERRKLLCEMMDDDAKSGLYNEKKREPLKEQDILDVCERYADNYPIEGRITVNSRSMRLAVEPLVEAARAKDAELIQRLVDEVAAWMQPDLDERFRGEQWHQSKRILDAAAAGFKPSE